MKSFISISALFILTLTFSQCNEQEPSGEEVKIRIAAEMVSCVGELEGECLQIQEGEQIGTENWSYFYYSDSILGFDYEPGFVYDILVRKVYLEDVPADASSVEYELIKVLEKTKVE